VIVFAKYFTVSFFNMQLFCFWKVTAPYVTFSSFFNLPVLKPMGPSINDVTAFGGGGINGFSTKKRDDG
jgi:hypothetical protein